MDIFEASKARSSHTVEEKGRLRTVSKNRIGISAIEIEGAASPLAVGALSFGGADPVNEITVVQIAVKRWW